MLVTVCKEVRVRVPKLVEVVAPVPWLVRLRVPPLHPVAVHPTVFETVLITELVRVLVTGDVPVDVVPLVRVDVPMAVPPGDAVTVAVIVCVTVSVMLPVFDAVTVPVTTIVITPCVTVLVPVPLPASVTTLVFVSPASAGSAASFATPRSSDSPVAESLLLAQLTNMAASAIADAYRTFVFMSLPHWPARAAQTRAGRSACCSTRTAHSLPTGRFSTLIHVPSRSPQQTRETPKRWKALCYAAIAFWGDFYVAAARKRQKYSVRHAIEAFSAKPS